MSGLLTSSFLSDDMQLTGPIPAELYCLTALLHLSLGYNGLTGTFSTQYGDLTALKYLYLHHNELEGTVPTELGDLTDLRQTYLHTNKLIGTIPTELGRLTKLIRIDISCKCSFRLLGDVQELLGFSQASIH
jgi:Leucine-rich repeat (LRR) protein